MRYGGQSTALPPGMIDISKDKRIIETINESLNKGDTVEIKKEPKGITLVRVSRKVIYREQ